VSSSEVRDTQPQESDGSFGLGIDGQLNQDSNVGTTLSVHGSLVERSAMAGLVINGADGTADSTVVRGTLGQGVDVVNLAAHRASLTLTQCVLDGNQGSGIVGQDADLVVDRTAVFSTRPDPTLQGYALYVGPDPAHPAVAPPTLKLTRTLLANSVAGGAALLGGQATVSQTWVRGVAARSDAALGDGIIAQNVQLDASNVRVEQAARAGVSMFQTAQVSLGSAALACDAIPLDGEGQSSFTAAGQVACSCDGTASQCQVLGSGLQPPPPIAPPHLPP
jgi:hypothetical protein